MRLRRIEDKIAGDLLPFAHDRSSDRAGEPASDAVAADDATIWLTAQSDALRAQIGAAPIPVATLPFLVGRVPVEGDAQPSRRPDLLIEDKEPFRLSRQHFMIARSGDRLLVSDLGGHARNNGERVGDRPPFHEGRRTAASRRKSRGSGRQGFTLQILSIHQVSRRYRQVTAATPSPSSFGHSSFISISRRARSSGLGLYLSIWLGSSFPRPDTLTRFEIGHEGIWCRPHRPFPVCQVL